MIDFTQEQLSVIETNLDDDQVVVAGPGAGKTACIIARIIYLHSVKNASLKKMCYLTYSKKMADEAVVKLSERNITEMFHAGTIDSLCWKFLEQKYRKITGRKDFSCEPSQIISLMIAELQSNPDWRPFEFDYVFLDEAQDLDALRFKVLCEMLKSQHLPAGVGDSPASKSVQVTIVGDPRQAIYQDLFAANPQLMFALRPKAIQQNLTTCFRCSPEITNFINKAFYHPLSPKMLSYGCDPSRSIKSIISARHLTGIKPNYIRLHAESNNMGICRDEVIDLVDRRIKQLIRKGSQPSDIMVISPSVQNASLHLMNRIRTLLMSSNIPSVLNKCSAESGNYHITSNAAKSHRKNAVYMGTIHSVKGSESKHVLVLNFYVGNGAFHRLASDSRENLDFQNLVYVACTRAKDTLDLFETCHMPSRCEAIESMKDIDDVSNVIVARSLELKQVNIPNKNTLISPSHIAVTERLKSLSPTAWDLMENISLPRFYKCSKSLDKTYQNPVFLRENEESQVYGIFMEMVIARHLAQTRGKVDIMKTFQVLPIVLSASEMKMLQKSSEAVFQLPAIKFEFSFIDREDLYAMIKQLRTSTNIGHQHFSTHSSATLKKRLLANNILVSSTEQLFYEQVSIHLSDLKHVSDLSLKTDSVIQAIWNAVLLKTFQETQLGLFWIKQIDTVDLLPQGAISWKLYLEQLSLLESAFPLQLSIEDYQAPMKIETTSKSTPAHKIVLTGIADMISENKNLIDIKCFASEKSTTSLYNKVQISAYRGMLGLDKDAFILSALSLNLYCLEANPSSDNKVVDNLCK